MKMQTRKTSAKFFVRVANGWLTYRLMPTDEKIAYIKDMKKFYERGGSNYDNH